MVTTYLSESGFGQDLSQCVCGQLVCILPPGQEAQGGLGWGGGTQNCSSASGCECPVAGKLKITKQQQQV